MLEAFVAERAYLLRQVAEAVSHAARARDVREPRITWTRPKSPIDDWEVDILLPGWSQTLHLSGATERLDMLGFAEDVVEWGSAQAFRQAIRDISRSQPKPLITTMLAYLAPHFDEQHRLAAAARALGLRAPLTKPTSARFVVMDRAVRHHLEIHGALGDAVPWALSQLHRDHGGTSPRLRVDGVQVEFASQLVDGTPPLPMLLARVPLVGLPTGATFDGLALHLPGASLPDIAMGAAVGRPLADVVETVPALAERAITGIENWISTSDHTPVLCVGLAPDPVPALPETGA